MVEIHDKRMMSLMPSLAAKQIQPYFPSHPTRDTYITLLQTEPPPKDQVIKAALVARAVTDVGRVLQLREDKPALQNLLQKGSVGDDFWNALLAAEKELEAEIRSSSRLRARSWPTTRCGPCWRTHRNSERKQVSLLLVSYLNDYER
jgi:hypothetical protein